MGGACQNGSDVVATARRIVATILAEPRRIAETLNLEVSKSANDLADGRLGVVYCAVRSLVASTGDASLHVVADELERRGELAKIGDRRWLANLFDDGLDACDLPADVDRVRIGARRLQIANLHRAVSQGGATRKVAEQLVALHDEIDAMLVAA